MTNDLLKIGQKILVEGSKVVTVGAGVTLIRVVASEGIGGLTKLDVSKLLK